MKVIELISGAGLTALYVVMLYAMVCLPSLVRYYAGWRRTVIRRHDGRPSVTGRHRAA